MAGRVVPIRWSKGNDAMNALETVNWTMEQHEAAAAALGSFAARLLRMGAPAPTSPVEPDRFAEGLTVGADQAARWMAREAWRHAAAVLRESEHKARALGGDDALKVVCCECKTVMQAGPADRVSHGLCKVCERRALAELDAEDAERWSGTGSPRYLADDIVDPRD